MIKNSQATGMKNRRIFFLLVQTAAVCVFAGRAYQHLFWDAPFRSILWSEDWMSWIVEGIFKTPWSEYVRNPETDIFIQNLIVGHGWFYLCCAVVAVFVRGLPKLLHYLLLLGALLLTVLAFMYTKEKFFHLGQFLEYSLQVSSPILLWYMVRNPNLPDRRFIFIVKLLIALTFTCHGLYALNYYPRPGNFTQMCLSILPITEAQAFQFLNFAGVMDFILAVGIFLPFRKVVLYSLAYAVFWGFFTSIARVWANFYFDFWQDSLHQWIWETVMRFPHFLIPFACLLFERERGKEQ